METDNFEEKVKDWLSKGAKVSRKALETVGDKVQDFTDKSVVKMEIKQLESKLKSKYIELGKIVYAAMAEKIEEENKNDCQADSSDDEKSLLNVGTEENLKKIEQLQSIIKMLISQIDEKKQEVK